jgi:hypothetical protein
MHAGRVLLFSLFTAGIIASPAGIAYAVSNTGADKAAQNPPQCNQLFGLPQGTITQGGKDATVMNPEVCAAYAFLISRYQPGSRSSAGLSNAKVIGITSLNPDFAVALAKMLKAMPGNIMINSAYRTEQGQGSKNPESNHRYGCAVDLGWSQSDCGSAACQWMQTTGPQYGLQIRMKYSPEWNHVEPINVQQCRAAGPGGGVTPTTGTPSSALADQIRQALGMPQQSSTQPPPPPPPPTSQPASTAPAPISSPAPTTAATPLTGTTPISTATPGSPTACTPQYSCSNGTYVYQTSSCTTITVQTCKYGCSSDGTTCATSGNQSQGTSTQSTSTSAFDLINQYANPVSNSIDIGTGTSIALNQDLQNIGGDVGATTSATSSDQVDSLGNVATLQPPGAQQTFTSGDLANSPGPTPMTTSNSLVGNLIAALQNILAFLGNYLRPFGGTPPGVVLPGSAVAD